MPNYIVPGEASGTNYRFTIAGEEPTVDELIRMRAKVRAAETAKIKSYEDTYGESATPGEGEGIANLAGEFFKGIGRGGVGLLETGALGAATLLPEEYEDPTREFIRRKGFEYTEGLQPDFGLADTRTGKFGEVLGSVAGTYAPALIPGIGLPLAAALATGAGAGEASERARAAGVDEATRTDAALKGAGVGVTELIPFVGPIQRRLRATGARNRILRAFEQGGIEGAQEAAANTLQNFIQQGYDPTQILTEGNLESAGYGAGAGGLVQLIVDLVIPGRMRGDLVVTDRGGQDTSEQITEQEDRQLTPEEQTQIQAAVDAADTAGETINEQADRIAEELSPEITGGPDDTTRVRDGVASDGQGPAVSESRDVPESATRVRASDEQAVEESGDDAAMSGRGIREESDTLTAEEEAAPVVTPEFRAANIQEEGDTDPTINEDQQELDKAQAAKDGAVKDDAAKDDEVVKSGKQLIPGFLYPTDPKTLETGKPYPESDERYAPRQQDKSTPAELEPSQREQPLPAGVKKENVPTLATLEELGADSKRTKVRRVLDSYDWNTLRVNEFPDAIRDVHNALAEYAKKLKGADNLLKRQKIEAYIEANSLPDTADGVEADIDKRDAEQQRKKDVQAALKNETAVVRREEAKAVREAADRVVTLPDTEGVQPVSEAEARETRIKAAREEALKDPERSSVALGNQPVRPDDADIITDEMRFEQWVKENTFVRKGKNKVHPKSSAELSPVQLATAAQTFANIQAANRAATTARASDEQAVEKAFEKQDRREAARVKAFEKWLKEQELDYLLKKKDRKTDEELVALRKEFDDRFTYDESGRLTEFMPLPIEYVVGLDYPVDPDTLTMLEDNNLGDALRQYARATPNPKFSAMAKALARVAGNTRVVFADVGDRVAGAFDPNTNIIVFNQNVPLTGHTLLHETLHAATSATIENQPGAASVRAIDNIYKEVRDIMPSYYGSSSLLEFVAEAFSNPKFQQQLAQLQVKGKYENAYEQFKRALARMARSIFNVQLKLRGKQQGKPVSALEELEAQIDSLLAPAPQNRNGTMLYSVANNPTQVNKLMNNALLNGPIFDEKGKQKYIARMEDLSRSNVSVMGSGVRKGILSATPLHYLVQVAQKYFPDDKTGGLLTRMNDIMNLAAGKMQEETGKSQVIINDLISWANKNRKKLPALNRLFNESTLYQVDPELNENTARKQYKDPERFARWQDMRRLVVEINRGGADGIAQYRKVRNFFRAKREELRKAMQQRLQDAGIDAATQKDILDSYYDRLTEQGAIEPYFPLTRKGDFWLEFNAIDPNTGRIEFYAEAFESDAQRTRALKELTPELTNNLLRSEAGRQAVAALKNTPEGAGMSDADIVENLIVKMKLKAKASSINFRNAPPTAFVNQLMGRINEATGGNEKVRQDVSELILNTLPETSYLQSFRKRKGGEVAKGALGYNPDAVSTIQDRANSITRQIVQMEYNGKFGSLENELQNYYNLAQDGSSTMRDYYDILQYYNRTGAFPPVSAASRVATGVAFNMTLGFNVSGGLVNLSQVPLIVYPFLGGKYGYPATGRALGQAQKAILKGGFKRKTEVVSTDQDGNPTTEEREIRAALSVENIDFANETDPTILDLKELVDYGVLTGQFRRSLDHEILDLDNVKTGWLGKLTKASGFFLFHGERMNRETSLVAAYKLELARSRQRNPNIQRNSPEDIQLRKDAAVQSVNDAEMMNGGLSAGAAPILSQSSLGRVVFMYKRYGVSMLSLLHKLAGEAVRGESAEARRVARFQLAGIYGSAGLLSGVAGMPLYGVVSLILDMIFDDDDEPLDDVDTIVRTYLGEGPFRGGLNYVTGVNFAGRVGLGELLFRDTFIRSDNPLLYQALEYGGGPLVCIVAQIERGAKPFG